MNNEILLGTVKTYYKEKGYGFIDGEDNVKRFFHITDIKSKDNYMPIQYDKVYFRHFQTSKGARAKDVVRASEIKPKITHIKISEGQNRKLINKPLHIKSFGWANIKKSDYYLEDT